MTSFASEAANGHKVETMLSRHRMGEARPNG
jgi:hypothetical protein